MKRVRYLFITLVIFNFLLIISCENSEITRSNPPEKNTLSNQNITDHANIDESDSSKSKSNYPVIYGSWNRVGNSGHGIDIEARDKIYIVGNNHRVYYYDNNANDWIREPGGGHAKRISMTNYNNTLIIRGNSNKVYKKESGEDVSWQKISDFEINDLSGPLNYAPEYANKFYITTPNTVLYGSGSNSAVYGWSSGIWIELEHEVNPFQKNIYEVLEVTQLNSHQAPIITADAGNYGVFENQLYSTGTNIWGPLFPNNPYAEKQAIDVAYENQSTIWFIGANHRIYRLKISPNGNQISIVNSGHGKRISVTQNGTVYIVGNNNRIYKFVQ